MEKIVICTTVQNKWKEPEHSRCLFFFCCTKIVSNRDSSTEVRTEPWYLCTVPPLSMCACVRAYIYIYHRLLLLIIININTKMNHYYYYCHPFKNSRIKNSKCKQKVKCVGCILYQSDSLLSVWSCIFFWQNSLNKLVETKKWGDGRGEGCERRWDVASSLGRDLGSIHLHLHSHLSPLPTHSPA